MNIAALLLAATVASSETELVRVSVVVADKSGRSVANLTASDFVLLDNGKPQEIVLLGAPAAIQEEIAAETPEGATAPQEQAPAPSVVPRSIVLAVDDLHISPQNLIGAQAALTRFVEQQLREGDQVAIVTTSGAGVSRAFTQDRRALVRAIEALQSHERRPNVMGWATLNEAHAEAIERGDSDALAIAVREAATLRAAGSAPTAPGAVDPRIAAEVKATARQIIAEFVQTSANMLGAVESIVRSLQALPGRKLIVLVSDGFLIGPATEPGAFDLRRLMDASARSDVAVYPLDSRGLITSPSGSAAAPTSHMEVGQQYRFEQMKELETLATFESIAQSTGGTFIRGTNDLGQGLDRILRDSGASYLVGFAPPNDGKRRFHKIEVKVPGRPGAIVRARKGYYSRGPGETVAFKETAAARREREIREALVAVVPGRGVPVRLRTDFVDAPPDGSQLVLSAHVDLQPVRFERADGRYRADLELVRVIADESGRVVAAAQGETVHLDLSDKDYERVRAAGIGYQTAVPLPPGRYEARFVVREGRLAQVGNANAWGELPDLSHGPLALSSVFLSKPAPDKASKLEIAQSTRGFARGSDLYYSLHVYNPQRSADGSTDVVVQSQVRRLDALQGVSGIEPVGFNANASSGEVRGRVSLEGLADGAYELRILVVDKKANKQAEQRIDFNVE